MLCDVEEWSAGLDRVFGLVAGRFGRADLRGRMRSYVRGLLGPVGRKNSWQVAEYVGDATPDGMQRLLNAAKWDAGAVRDDVREYVIEHLGGPDGVLIFDETGFIKKGKTSAGVSKQYTGTSGKIDNCQVAVFAAYASSKGRALIDRQLYLPHCWTDDRDRCRAAGIGDDVEFAKKTEIARTMLDRILDAGVIAPWVTADEAYGQDSKFRRHCEERGIGYVVAVPRSQHVPSGGLGMGRADALAAAAPPAAWRRLSAGDGAKGPRLYDWASARLPERDDDEPIERWLLLRRNISDPTDIAYYLCGGPAGTPITELVRVAGARWAIEECFQAAKNETGLDQYEVRRYHAWYRHITLAMLAHAFLAVTAAQAAEKGAPATIRTHSYHSPWQRSGDSWQL